MANLASEVVSRVDSAAHDLKGKAQATENYLEKMSHDAGKRIGVMAADVSNATTEYVQTSREYVRENPIKSVAIAAAAGVVTGSLLTMIARRH